MTQGCLIRIVDDDEDMRESLSFLLESEGWKCSAYSSARECGQCSGMFDS